MTLRSILFSAIAAIVACMVVTPVVAQPQIRHTIEAPKRNAQGDPIRMFLRCDLGAKEEQLVALMSGEKVYDRSILEYVVTHHLVSYDLKTGKETNRIPLGPFRAGRGDSFHCEFNARYSLVVVSSSSAGSAVVDISKMRNLYASKSLIGQSIISANGEFVAWPEVSTDRKTGDEQANLVVFHCDTRKLLRSKERVDGEVHALVFSPDSASLATFSGDGKARVWNTATAKLEKEIVVPAPPLAKNKIFQADLMFTPNNKSLCTVSYHRHGGILNFPGPYEVRLWDLKTGAGRPLVKRSIVPPSELFKTFNATPFFRISPDSKSIAIFHQTLDSDDIRLVVYDMEKSRFVRDMQCFDSRTEELANGITPELYVSPDGKTLATVATTRGSTSYGGSLLKLWDFDSGRQIAKLTEHDDGAVTQVIFSSDEKTMITMNYGTIRIWDLN